MDVLNINELANALKPIVLPGEIMKVFILKEGKEYNQGVAYLDDGTMVVVDNARKMIGKTIDISVTSVLQTTAGKMIFGKFDERGMTGRPAEMRPPDLRKNNPQPPPEAPEPQPIRRRGTHEKKRFAAASFRFAASGRNTGCALPAWPRDRHLEIAEARAYTGRPL